MEVKYPDVVVQLTGQNSNAFNIIGLVKQAMRRKNVPIEDQKAFTDEAMSGDYDHLLQTCMKWVTVD